MDSSNHDKYIDDPLDDAPLLGPQTAEQHRAAAISLLRQLVDSPSAKPQDRRAAASDLLKILGEETADPVAERKAQQMTDDELLLVIADAQARRGRVGGGIAIGGTQTPSAPESPGGEGSSGFTWNEGGPDDASVAVQPGEYDPALGRVRHEADGRMDLEALLADVPEIPSAEELCS